MQSTENSTSIPDSSQWFIDAFHALDVKPSEVARELGIENSKIYNIVNGKFKPGYETVRQILNAYPRLNANWLLKGQLPILHKSGAIIEGSGNKGSASEVTLPLYEAGNGYNGHQETYTLPIFEDRTESYSSAVVVRLTDNSMLPKYPVGMRLLAKPVAMTEWEYLNSKLVMVLYRTTLVVRRVKENELISKNYLTLYADSEEAGFVLIRREDLKSIWEIIDILGRGNDL